MEDFNILVNGRYSKIKIKQYTLKQIKNICMQF